MNSNQCILVWASDIVWKKKKMYCKYHNGINLSMLQYEQLFLQKSVIVKKDHAHKQTMMRLFWIFNFLLFISPFYGFLFKGSCSSKSILFIYSYFLQRKILYNLFFFFSKQYLEEYHLHTLFYLIWWSFISNAKLRR